MSSPPTRKPQSPSSYAGFSLQPTRVLYRLLTAEEGDIVSLEVFDDVAVDQSTGDRIVEQDKNTLTGNPLSNRSRDLWKTFSNWLDAVKDGKLAIDNTTFEIYVSKAAGGDIVEAFSEANDFAEAEAAFEEAKKYLWGNPPEFEKREKLSSEIAKYVNRVFETDADTVVRIIEKFKLVVGSGSPIGDVEKLFRKQFVKDFNVQKLMVFAHGWVKLHIDKLHEQGLPAFVTQEEFHRELTALTGKVDRQEILTRFAPNPTEEEIESDLNFRTYVRQLEIIDCDFDDRITAVKHFLAASADRTKWSELGIVHETSFDAFEEQLKTAWKNHKRGSDAELGDKDDVIRGRHLYSKCALHIAKLEGMNAPDYFTCGSFHALSDQKEIGWHPNYVSKLNKG